MIDQKINIKTLLFLSEEAMGATLNLWGSKEKTFWRSTAHKSRINQPLAFFPTVSLRCIEAFISTLINNPDWLTPKEKLLIFEEFIPRLLELNVSDLKSSMDKDGELNEFTLAVYTQAFSGVCKALQNSNQEFDLAQEKLENAVDNLCRHSFFQKDNTSYIINEHPFILFHLTRAFTSSLTFIRPPETLTKVNSLLKKISDSSRKIIERLLAKYQLRSLSPSENVALAFCAATLTQCDLIENRRYVLTALKICVEGQISLGCWPLGRLVHKDKDVENPHLEISTHEIAWSISYAILEIIKNFGIDYETLTLNEIVDRLIKSISYTESSLLRITEKDKNLSGWCSDQPYDQEIIESWTSANVLLFVSSMSKLREIYIQQEILKSFSTVYPSDKNWPGWLKWNKYQSTSEVNYDYPILGYLEKRVLDPIKNHPQNLSSSDSRSVSLLLFGPPGTSKTTIVKAIAGFLNWPLVILSPGNFIEGGLESIERLAQSVFDRLMNLSRTVILFDECDELFRGRSPIAESEQMRSITAFITACMLPKLQELHDRGKVVFCICTNNFDSIDPAVKRGGRIDHIIGIGPPDKIARLKIIDSCIETMKYEPNGLEGTLWAKVRFAISDQTVRFTRTEIIRAVNLFLKTKPWKGEDDAYSHLSKIVKNFQGSLTVSEEEFSKFEEQNKTFSHNVIEGQ